MAPAGTVPGAEPQFRDLGPLAVRIGGVERSPGGPRPAAALALLLMNANRRVGADSLRESMWGDTTGSHAASTLETHMFRLRKVVEPTRRPGEPPSVVLAEPGGYRLVVSPDQVDSIRFAQLADDSTELLRTGQPQRARRKSEEALDLWRGCPFEAVADELWAAPTVTRLLEVRAQLQQTRLQALLDMGEPDAALRDVAPILAEHPLRERLSVLRMLACYRCGRVDDALGAAFGAPDRPVGLPRSTGRGRAVVFRGPLPQRPGRGAVAEPGRHRRPADPGHRSARPDPVRRRLASRPAPHPG